MENTKTHLKILAVIYLGIGILLALFCLLMVFSALAQANPHAGEALSAIIPLTIWILAAGWGLWQPRPKGWIFPLITGIVLMLVLHSLFLFADGGKFARSSGQKVFHFVCVGIGIYTTIILLLPQGRAEFKD